MAAPFVAHPELSVVPLFTLAMVLCVPLAIRRGRPGMACLASCATILGL
jgi:hypothetical protein